MKTNIPQALMFWECVNPTWGRTLNPYSAAHTCGGSSGGEGALLAMDGSALGWGNDIGGSLRIPASFCGVYSLKPGHGRVPVDGVRGECGLGGRLAVRFTRRARRSYARFRSYPVCGGSPGPVSFEWSGT